jgi:hypothetical protein
MDVASLEDVPQKQNHRLKKILDKLYVNIAIMLIKILTITAFKILSD